MTSPALRSWYKDKKLLLVLAADPTKGENQHASLIIFHSQNKPAITLGKYKDTNVGLTISDETALRATLEVQRQEDQAQLGLFDRAGNVRVAAGSTKDGPKFSLLDEKGVKVFSKP